MGHASDLASHQAPASTLIIAHRGASGYLPEHTLAAYSYAYAAGADMIEPDVVLTSDGVPICSHDLYADATTDALELFGDRARTDDRGVSRVFYADLTLADVRRLSSRGRPQGESEARGSASKPAGHRVPTLDEMIALVRGLNRDTGRSVGIVPELKGPQFHAQRGLALTRTVLDVLARHGYTSADDAAPAIVQCFDLAALREARFEHGSRLELVYLVKDAPDDAMLDDICAWVDGIGPDKRLIDDAPDGLLTRARTRGLKVYPYTFKREPDLLARFIHRHRVDGVFCDYPDVGLAAREATIVAE
jgi:glycerophosphoryl diester phosphodiesterase